MSSVVSKENRLSDPVGDSEREETASQKTTSLAPTGQGETIASILEDDDLLLAVLRHVVKDGLHECRQVCKRWRAVCNAISLKLNLTSCEDILEIPSNFPCVRELCCTLHSPTTASPFSDFLKRGPDMLTEVLLPSLVQLKNLRSLTIWSAQTAAWSMLDKTVSPFLPLVNLQSLTIKGGYDFSFDSACDAIRPLTNLTALKVPGLRMRGSGKVKPLSEIRLLRELELSVELFVHSGGQPLFPALSHLTHLGLSKTTSANDMAVFSPKVLTKVKFTAEE